VTLTPGDIKSMQKGGKRDKFRFKFNVPREKNQKTTSRSTEEGGGRAVSLPYLCNGMYTRIQVLQLGTVLPALGEAI